MDLSGIISAILEGGPLVIALGIAGVVIWALIQVIQALQKIIESNEHQDDKQQQINQQIIDNQRRLREDIELHSERKLKEERAKYEALACRVEGLEQDTTVKENEINELRQQVEGQKKEIATLNRTVQQRDKRISELADLIKDLTDANEASAIREKDKDKLIGDLQDELMKVQKSRAEAARKSEEKEATIAKLEERLDAVEKKADTGPLGEAKKDIAA